MVQRARPGHGRHADLRNEQKAYTLTDRGTYLAMKDKLPDLAIMVGGNNLAENKDKALLNPYGIMAVNPDKYPGVNADLAKKFVAGSRPQRHRRTSAPSVRTSSASRCSTRIRQSTGPAQVDPPCWVRRSEVM